VPEPPVCVAVLAALGVAGVAVYRLHRVRRALIAERASRRLTDGMRHRDMEAFQLRLEAALGTRAVLTEADRILDSALTAHYPEGGPK
jgi:hypothetical protein